MFYFYILLVDILKKVRSLINRIIIGKKKNLLLLEICIFGHFKFSQLVI